MPCSSRGDAWCPEPAAHSSLSALCVGGMHHGAHTAGTRVGTSPQAGLPLSPFTVVCPPWPGPRDFCCTTTEDTGRQPLTRDAPRVGRMAQSQGPKHSIVASGTVQPPVPASVGYTTRRNFGHSWLRAQPSTFLFTLPSRKGHPHHPLTTQDFHRASQQAAGVGAPCLDAATASPSLKQAKTHAKGCRDGCHCRVSSGVTTAATPWRAAASCTPALARSVVHLDPALARHSPKHPASSAL